MAKETAGLIPEESAAMARKIKAAVATGAAEEALDFLNEPPLETLNALRGDPRRQRVSVCTAGKQERGMKRRQTHTVGLSSCRVL